LIAITAGARQLLARLQPVAAASGRTRSLVEIAVLHALAAAADDDAAAAQQSVQAALDLAAEGGFVRIFIDAGPTLHAALHRVATGKDDLYRQALLAALPAPVRAQPLVEPLTPRELDILHLIAKGASNREIAEQLVLTVGTVKGHVNKLLGKLDAPSRTAAVARARALGLLET
jgi:LuxR family maltose regulon positive regulatory protein